MLYSVSRLRSIVVACRHATDGGALIPLCAIAAPSIVTDPKQFLKDELKAATDKVIELERVVDGAQSFREKAQRILEVRGGMRLLLVRSTVGAWGARTRSLP